MAHSFLISSPCSFSSIRTGVNVKTDIEGLKAEVPHIVVGTPGRVLDLATKRNVLDLSKVKHFVLDECDRLLAEVDMRRDVQNIFKATPPEKQVMMYSATLDKEIRPVCRKFCQNPMEIFVDDDTKLTLHGLQQYYIRCVFSDIRIVVVVMQTERFNALALCTSWYDHPLTF